MSIHHESGELRKDGRLRPSGGSTVITVPSELDFAEGDPVEIDTEPGRITVTGSDPADADGYVRTSGNSLVVTLTEPAREAGLEEGDVTVSVPMDRELTLVVRE